MRDPNFPSSMNEKVKASWFTFKNLTENYKEVAEEMLANVRTHVCNMSVKLPYSLFPQKSWCYKRGTGWKISVGYWKHGSKVPGQVEWSNASGLLLVHNEEFISVTAKH